MELRTASQAFSLARSLEDDSAEFYDRLASAFPAGKELFSGFAAENRRFKTQVERAYYGVITDAIEGGFAFDMETDDFDLDTSDPASLDAARQRALQIEETVVRFYEVAAEQSRVLMADLPRAFDQVVRKRKRRFPQLGGDSG